MRILAVDDDEDYLALLEVQFRDAGIDLATCTSGSRALALLEEHAFDVVMVDLLMPAMDGRVLARQIRGRRRHADLPIVMMTHMKNIGVIAATLPGDANLFVDKGGEPAWLIHLVTHLSGRRAS